MFYYEILKALHRDNVRYLLIGGFSVNLHGVPRTTQDIDLVISMERENVLTVVSMMRTLGYMPCLPVDPGELADAEKVQEWILNKNLKAFSFYHSKESYQVVDIRLVHPLNFENAYKERIIRKVKDIEISLVSIDDLIRMKEFSGRDQDLSDIAMLRKVLQLNRGRS